MIYVLYYLIATTTASFAVILACKSVRTKGYTVLTEEIDTSNLSGVNLYKIYAKIKNSCYCRDTIFLIAMADRGFIKIRDMVGELFVDKTVDFENVEPKSRAILEAMFNGATETFVDENSIMPVPTVPWKNAFKQYKSKISEVLGEFSDNNVIRKKSRDFYFLFIIVIWLMYSVMAGIAEGYQAGPADIIGDALATAILLLVAIVVFYVLIKINMLLIKKRDKRADVATSSDANFDKIRHTIGSGFKFIFVGFSVIFGAFWLIIFVCMLMVIGADSDLFISNIIEIVILFIVTCVVLVSELIRKYGKANPDPSDVIRMNIDVNNIMQYIHSEADASNLYILACMLGRRDILGVLDHKMNSAQEWYVGDEWKGIQDILVRLEDSKLYVK